MMQNGFQNLVISACIWHKQKNQHFINFFSNSLKFFMLYSGVSGLLEKPCIVDGSAMRLCSSKLVVSSCSSKVDV